MLLECQSQEKQEVEVWPGSVPAAMLCVCLRGLVYTRALHGRGPHQPLRLSTPSEKLRTFLPELGKWAVVAFPQLAACALRQLLLALDLEMGASGLLLTVATPAWQLDRQTHDLATTQGQRDGAEGCNGHSTVAFRD